MRCTTSEGTTCSLIVTATNKKQVDTQGYVMTVISISFLITGKVTLFYAGICALEKRSPVYS
jgi:hypothetical protein